MKNYWNFEKVSKIYNDDYLDKLKRYNPDGVDTNWIFKLKKKNIFTLKNISKILSKLFEFQNCFCE
jgi:hypothetical protein